MSNFSSQPTSAGSFQLYIRNKEAEAMAQLIAFVNKLPDHQRKTWLKDHGQFLDRAMENMLDATDHTFANLNMDYTLMQQTQTLLENIKKTHLEITDLLEANKLAS